MKKSDSVFVSNTLPNSNSQLSRNEKSTNGNVLSQANQLSYSAPTFPQQNMFQKQTALTNQSVSSFGLTQQINQLSYSTPTFPLQINRFPVQPPPPPPPQAPPPLSCATTIQPNQINYNFLTPGNNNNINLNQFGLQNLYNSNFNLNGIGQNRYQCPLTSNFFQQIYQTTLSNQIQSKTSDVNCSNIQNWRMNYQQLTIPPPPIATTKPNSISNSTKNNTNSTKELPAKRNNEYRDKDKNFKIRSETRHSYSHLPRYTNRNSNSERYSSLKRKLKKPSDVREDFDMAQQDAIQREREKRQALQHRRESRFKNNEELHSQKKTFQNRPISPELPPVPKWIRSSPATLYFEMNSQGNTVATERMQTLEKKFDSEVLSQLDNDKSNTIEKQEVVLPKVHFHSHRGCCGFGTLDNNGDDDDDSDDTNSSSSDSEKIVEPEFFKEMIKKQQHPRRLHKEAWFNESQQLNTGPICKCSLNSKKHGIRHDIYPGEVPIKKCVQQSNSSSVLYHYRVAVSPYNNFLTGNPTIIVHDEREYTFEGFSIFSHNKLDENIPQCLLSRYGFLYRIHWFKEEPLHNYDIKSLDLFAKLLFFGILELVDLDWLRPSDDCCPLFHVMPRFSRILPENGKEILSMNEVLSYLLKSWKPLIDNSDWKWFSDSQWMDYIDKVRGSLVMNTTKKPTSLRVDQIDRGDLSANGFPTLIHFGARPAQLSYMGDSQYQRLSREVLKLKHLYSNKPKVTREEKRSLAEKEDKLKNMKLKSELKKEVTIEVCTKGFNRTGLNCDVCQHALLLPVLVSHLRFHQCLSVLEKTIDYKFKDRSLLQLAVTHPSYRPHYGTNPDHVRNTLTNCGIRHTEYGDKENLAKSTRKRGITTLIHIMSMMGKKERISSEVDHYERLEFLGDAIIEFITSIRLFFMFPDIDEGGLAMYRSALVCNQNLAILAKKLKLDDYMLYAHGPDLCHRSELRHAMANSFEALMGALFLDDGLKIIDKVLSEVLWVNDDKLKTMWFSDKKHQLQNEFPDGDRLLIENSPVLQKIVELEKTTGIKFHHIRLLAKALTLKSVSYNWLTRGHNQRLEFLGDTVLQLVSSVFLYLHFPNHHEGHLSLLRSSLVNAKTQSQVAIEIGLPNFIIANDKHINLNKAKALADLLEAYIGALFIDQGLETVKVFCNVCFFPRLQEFIIHQKWNDPKSQLQQCCITLRNVGGGDPEIPIYKEISRFGPTNRRCFKVAVYFKNKRLSIGQGRCLREAQMDAAQNALNENADLFPQIKYQRRIVQQKYNLPLNDDSLSTNKCEEVNEVINQPLPRQYTNDEKIVQEEITEDCNINEKSIISNKNQEKQTMKENIIESRKLPFAPVDLDKFDVDLPKPKEEVEKKPIPRNKMLCKKIIGKKKIEIKLSKTTLKIMADEKTKKPDDKFVKNNVTVNEEKEIFLEMRKKIQIKKKIKKRKIECIDKVVDIDKGFIKDGSSTEEGEIKSD